jgi:hypothetical protein
MRSGTGPIRVIRRLAVGVVCMVAALLLQACDAQDLPDPPGLNLRSVSYVASDVQTVTVTNGEYQVFPSASVRVEADAISSSYGYYVCINGNVQSCPAEKVPLDDLHGDKAAWALSHNADATRQYFHILPRAGDRDDGPVMVTIQPTLRRSEANTVVGPTLTLKLVERRPPPTPKATVPDIVGLTSFEAHQILGAGGFRTEHVANLSNPVEIDSKKLVVLKQDPVAGAKVDYGSVVNYSVTSKAPDPAFKSVRATNNHVDKRALTIHLWSPGTGWQQVAGPLSYGASASFDLHDGPNYLVAVDQELVGCNDGAPDNVSCQRYLVPLRGDSGGQELPVEIT